MQIFVAKSGKLKGKSFPLGRVMVFGRGSGCDVVIAANGVSRKHAVAIAREDGAVVLRDLASRNGTRMGEKRVRQVFLAPGDQFSIGCDHPGSRRQSSDNPGRGQ